MKILPITKAISIAVGLVFLYLGNQADNFNQVLVGVSFLGLSALLQGSEVILKRRINYEPTGDKFEPTNFLEWSDVARGILFILLGVVITGVVVAALFNTGSKVFQFIIAHPGSALVILGICCFLYAVVTIIGQGGRLKNLPLGKRFAWFTSNLLPGFLLIMIGLILMGLGLLDLILPRIFYQLLGRYLQILFAGS